MNVGNPVSMVINHEDEVIGVTAVICAVAVFDITSSRVALPINVPENAH